MSTGPLSERIGHRFSDTALLKQALTHRSAGSPHNERLEFLGDAVLSFLIAEALYRRFDHAREGELTRLRASLVKGPTLAALGRQLALGPELRLGSGELKSGGRERESILADAFEAILGAIYLDGGLTACRDVVGRIFAERLAAASPGRVDKDPKTRLQEWLQSRRMMLPTYAVLGTEGDGHHQLFTVECRVESLQTPIQGRGTSRRKAEQDAAEKTLAILTDG